MRFFLLFFQPILLNNTVHKKRLRFLLLKNSPPFILVYSYLFFPKTKVYGKFSQAFLKLSLLLFIYLSFNVGTQEKHSLATISVSKPQSLSANRNNSQIFSRLFLMWHSNHTYFYLIFLFLIAMNPSSSLITIGKTEL